jgi:hypothetical protein
MTTRLTVHTTRVDSLRPEHRGDMRAFLGWTCLLHAALTGCGGAGMGAAADAPGLCAGTPIAGTCVERFFAPFAACWKGGAPPCTQQQGVTTTVQCYPSGARVEAQIGDDEDATHLDPERRDLHDRHWIHRVGRHVHLRRRHVVIRPLGNG